MKPRFSTSVISVILLTATAALSVCAWMVIAWLRGAQGFPLDDAWIHQTYARSLGLNGEWTFLPGRQSAGSTSPLWTGILSLGYLVRLDPLVFSTMIGILCLAGLAWVINKHGLQLVGVSWVPWAGLFMCLEWHLVWAALSGMETLLFAFINTAVLAPVISMKRARSFQFLLCGLAVWIRPEGITLAVPLLLTLAFQNGSLCSKLARAAFSIGVLGLVIAPYLYLNWQLSGVLLPNTFYAKQAEYAALLETPIVARLWGELLPVMTGAGALLLPGFIWHCYLAVRSRNWGVIGGAAWWLGTLCLYAVRLPVTYQHGRYLIPSMPVFFLIGLLGTKTLLDKTSANLGGRVLRKAGLASLVVVLAAFWVMGTGAYLRDVSIIEGEMVAASKWISSNTPGKAVIAAHDIGALGYYGGRDIIDLAGLINPEVIPYIRDEAALADYLDRTAPAYLLTFPDWYPDLVNGLHPVYCTEGKAAVQAGGENMCVYVWSR